MPSEVSSCARLHFGGNMHPMGWWVTLVQVVVVTLVAASVLLVTCIWIFERSIAAGCVRMGGVVGRYWRSRAAARGGSHYQQTPKTILWHPQPSGLDQPALDQLGQLHLEEEGGDGVRRAGEVGRRLRPQLCVGSVGGGPGRVAELEGRQK